jgi:hypothetical protein
MLPRNINRALMVKKMRSDINSAVAEQTVDCSPPRQREDIMTSSIGGESAAKVKSRDEIAECLDARPSDPETHSSSFSEGSVPAHAPLFDHGRPTSTIKRMAAITRPSIINVRLPEAPGTRAGRGVVRGDSAAPASPGPARTSRVLSSVFTT